MWQKLKSTIPNTVQSLLLRLLAVLGLLSISRIVFYILNADSFKNVIFTDWIIGAWFDLVTLSLLLLPFIALSLLPTLAQKNWGIRLLKICTFFIPVLFILALNLVDTEYFKFTQKRSTSDLFAIVSAGNDVGQLLTSFIRDFWLLIVFFVLFLIAMIWFYKKSSHLRWKKSETHSVKKELIYFFVLIPFFILFGRGGIMLKPISAIDATLYTEPQNTALVLNSAFTVVKSYGKDDLVEIDYYSEKELKRLFTAVHQSQPQNILPNKTNVIVIMLESFGNEWVGTFNNKTSYTPFLDSLLTKSWYFEHGFSNGKKSIEAVPTIVASMPTLMDNPYISSAYGSNRFEAIPTILKNKGYHTAFYHGATNGSMRFNSYTKQVGFEEYIGRFEYDNDAHFDKTWGILDEYFEPWMAQQLSKTKTPFFATLFTLSSHHPYYVPPHWRKKVKKGPEPICKSINYGDISLRKLFEQAKKEPWYNNTLFVLVADHTPATNSQVYSERTQMYQIPIAFFDPSGKLAPKKDPKLFQQLDIMPTVLDLINVNATYYSFGKSYFSKEPREAVSYLEGSYYYFCDGDMLVLTNDKIRHLYNYTERTKKPKDQLKQKRKKAEHMARRLRAIIQTYNNDLIHNRTIVQ